MRPGPLRPGPRGGRCPGPGARKGWPALLPLLLTAACLDPGEPTVLPALVTWVAHPDTVVAGETFSLEVAGPITHDTCGGLDTMTLAVDDSTVRLAARRSVYLDAWCSEERVSFYEVRPLVLERPGRYRLWTERIPGAFPGSAPPDPGELVVLDSGRFSAIRTRGVGTVRRGGGCLLFGPGWANNQRPFALLDPPERVDRAADTDTLVSVVGPLVGFSLCGGFGSRPAIRVEEGRVLPSTGADYYGEGSD